MVKVIRMGEGNAESNSHGDSNAESNSLVRGIHMVRVMLRVFTW